jgi:hypothetical protein
MTGLDSKLTSYGDAAFSRYLRRASLASAGYDRVDLERHFRHQLLADYAALARRTPTRLNR